MIPPAPNIRASIGLLSIEAAFDALCIIDIQCTVAYPESVPGKSWADRELPVSRACMLARIDSTAYHDDIACTYYV